MKLINQGKFNIVMKNGLNASEKQNGIIRVSRKPICISKEDAANWLIPYKPHKEEPVPTPEWFEKFHKEYKVDVAKQHMFNTRIESDIKELKSDVAILKSDVSVLKSNQKLMMNTPTMKRELKLK